MYLNKQKRPNGDIYLSIKEKYYVPKKGARERTIESIGYVNELKKQYEDPVAFFSQRALDMTNQKKKKDPSQSQSIVTKNCRSKLTALKTLAMGY